MNWKNWRIWRKKYLIVDDCILNKVSDKIKETIILIDSTKIWLTQMINCQMILL